MAKKVKLNIWIIIIAILAVIVLAKDVFIKMGIETAVKAVTGLPLKIDSLHVGVTSSLVDIKGLKVYNPAGFEEKLMVNIPAIYVDYRLSSIFRGKIELNDMKLHLSEFIIVKNSKGDVNLEHLKAMQGQEPPPKIDMQIDNLALKVEKVIYKDYSKGGEPSVREFNIGIDQTYRDIKNLNAVIGIIVVRSLAQTTIANLAGIDISGMTDMVSGTLKGATNATKKVIGTTTDTLKGTTDTLKDTTENLKGIIKNPFGSK